MKRWSKLLVVLFTLCLGLLGCEKQQAEDESLDSYKIYYLNTAGTKMVSQDYQTDTTDVELLIQELMEQFLKVPDNLDAQVALSTKVAYENYRKQDMVLYLYFDNNYASMKLDQEILCRAALTKTLTQIVGVDYISIYTGEQPIVDSFGSPVGILSGNDFVESNKDVNTFKRLTITLYFTDTTGEFLYPETREVMQSTNTSTESVILEELIAGPEQLGLLPVLDPSTKLINISINENVCYLNFNETFLTNTLEVKSYIPIYAIVNSLSESALINKVQITVNGSKDVIFRETISLDTLFERNLDYIGGK